MVPLLPNPLYIFFLYNSLVRTRELTARKPPKVAQPGQLCWNLDQVFNVLFVRNLSRLPPSPPYGSTMSEPWWVPNGAVSFTPRNQGRIRHSLSQECMQLRSDLRLLEVGWGHRYLSDKVVSVVRAQGSHRQIGQEMPR